MDIEEKIPDIDNLTDSEINELIKKLNKKKNKEKRNKPETAVKYLTAKEVADILGISVNKVYELARSGAIKSAKIGGSVRFNPQDLISFISDSRFKSKYDNEAFCKKTCILSINGDLIPFKELDIYRIMNENRIWIYLYNSQFEKSIRIGKKKFQKYFMKATELEIDAALFNLGPNFG